jgi:hypothetical protein
MDVIDEDRFLYSGKEYVDYYIAIHQAMLRNRLSGNYGFIYRVHVSPGDWTHNWIVRRKVKSKEISSHVQFRTKNEYQLLYHEPQQQPTQESGSMGISLNSQGIASLGFNYNWKLEDLTVNTNGTSAANRRYGAKFILRDKATSYTTGDQYYYGLFVLMQEMNAGNLGLKKKNDGAMLFKEPPVFFEKKKDADTHENYYQQKFPKLAKVDKTNELSRLHDFILLSSDFDFQSEINSWFDMRNLVDWYLILQLSFNSDGITKNFILYKTEEKIPFRIALWDYDHSFGRDGDNEKNEMNSPMNMKKSVLFRRLLEIKAIGFEEMVKKRWVELRNQGVFSSLNLFSKMDEMDAQIKLEQAKNFARWSEKSEWYFDANSYEQELEWMKKSIRKRIAQLDKKFKYNT